jgi:hypothetical protein
MKTFKQLREKINIDPDVKKVVNAGIKRKELKLGKVAIQKNGKTLVYPKDRAKEYLKKGWKINKNYFDDISKKLPKDYYKGLE